jgi:hypothetical protein
MAERNTPAKPEAPPARLAAFTASVGSVFIFARKFLQKKSDNSSDIHLSVHRLVIPLGRAVLWLARRSFEYPAQADVAMRTNIRIIRFYQDIQNARITPALAKAFMIEEGLKLKTQGEPYYYLVRERFNARPSSLDFLFLNRSCFNGVMRFNRSGKFNGPYCRKPERFAKSYVTKITNPVRQIAQVISVADWSFEVREVARPWRR